jgi:chaperonin cofactor prefoldin
VGGVLIDQTYKDAITTLSQRVAHINTQIDKTGELIKKNETEQVAMGEKIQKAKAFYTQMVQHLQQKK